MSQTPATRREAADLYEAFTITFTDGTRYRIINVLETSRRFCTANIQRINKDGSIDKRDQTHTKVRTFQHSAIANQEGAT